MEFIYEDMSEEDRKKVLLRMEDASIKDEVFGIIYPSDGKFDQNILRHNASCHIIGYLFQLLSEKGILTEREIENIKIDIYMGKYGTIPEN